MGSAARAGGRLVVLLIGQQGTGKSTLGNALAELRGFRYLSGGVLIRRQIAAETEIGLRIRGPIADGDRVPPELTHQLLAEELAGEPVGDLVLDGFPQEAREHPELIEVVGEPDLVLMLNGVPTDELVQRVENRLECPGCYTTFTIGEAVDCPQCARALRRRPEDGRTEKILRRHRRWVASAPELSAFYAELGILAEIDARRSREEVRTQALRLLDETAKRRT